MGATEFCCGVSSWFAEGAWADTAAVFVLLSAGLCFLCRFVCDYSVDLVKSSKNNHWGFVPPEADSNGLSSNCITVKA